MKAFSKPIPFIVENDKIFGLYRNRPKTIGFNKQFNKESAHLFFSIFYMKIDDFLKNSNISNENR